MSVSALHAVGKRLEAAVVALTPNPVSASDLYDLYEATAITILDSEHGDFPPGELQAYLLGYLDGLPLPR